MSSKEALILKGIDILLSALRFASNLGINYEEVIAAQKQAEEERGEGAELTTEERQPFLDQAQSKLDEL